VTPTIARRLRIRARIITIGAIAGAIAVIVGGAVIVAVASRPGSGILVGYLVAVVTLVTTIGILARVTTRRARALRSLAARHPDDIVFLARRLPPVVSDLPAFLAAKGIDAEIGDGWYPGTAHADGITVWTDEADPRELIRIEWSEIGDVLAVRTPTVGGDRRWTVTVDVKPYVVPLTVDVGYAWGIVTMAMGAADTADLVAAIGAHRPDRAVRG
jgi:hypothetical protein